MWYVVYLVCLLSFEVLRPYKRYIYIYERCKLNQMYTFFFQLLFSAQRNKNGFASKVSVFVFRFILITYALYHFNGVIPSNSKLFQRLCRQIVCHYIMHATINHKLLSLLTCNTLIVCFHIVRI